MKVVANTRTAQGTSASRRLRRADKVPGIIYGGKSEPVAIELEHNPLFHALRKEKFHASILDMELDGKGERVLLRTYQMHPYKPQVLHIDFQRVAEDQPIHMRVPLHFAGQENSPAVKLNAAIVSHVMSEVEIACLPKDLPEFIEVDLSGLKSTDVVKVLDLKMPAGVKTVVKGKENPVVVTVSVPGGATEDESAAPAAADVPATAQKAPAAAPAAGGKAAPAAKSAAPAKDKKK
ncbi:MAG: 50S ribosomal protein L25/general stress protein Ctc [Burkholderiaceae bacterium]|nr:50S ribosomal protein L25/general stress protein Ctc [Burkholderiaceae bacterium]